VKIPNPGCGEKPKNESEASEAGDNGGGWFSRVEPVESSLFSLTNSHTHPDDASNLISDGERRRIESPRTICG